MMQGLPVEATSPPVEPTPVQPEIVAPQAVQEPISAAPEPVESGIPKTYAALVNRLSNPRVKDGKIIEEDRDLYRKLFPEYTEKSEEQVDTSNDYEYGIWRAANKGDEKPRWHTSSMVDGGPVLSERHKALIAPAKPKRTPPPAKGSTSSTGWSTVAKGVARKDIMGRNVEIVRQADGSWSVTRDEQEMDSGYKSRAEAEKYADGELAQDIRDQRNADEEAALSAANEVEKTAKKPPQSKEPWDMTPEEFKENYKDLGDPNNKVYSAVRYKDGTIYTSKNASHDEIMESLDASGDESMDDLHEDYRGFSWKGKKTDPYIVFMRDMEESDADVQKAIIKKAGKQGPAPADTGILRDLTAAAREGKRNAEEEERGVGVESAEASQKQPWEMTNSEFDLWARPLIGLKSDAPISKEATAFMLENKGMGLKNLSPQGVRKWARENGKQVPDFRPESTSASNEEIDSHLLKNGYSSFSRIASDLGFRIDDSDKQTQVVRRALALEDEGKLVRKDTSGGAFDWKPAPPTGPAPADTGIFRDLTAAAREGKRNAEEEERGAGEEPAKAPRPQKTLLEQSIQDMEESDPESVKQRIRENLTERESRKVDAIYERLLKKASPAGPNLYEVDGKFVTPAMRKALKALRGSGMIETPSFYMRHKQDVTGQRYEKDAWIIRDRRNEKPRGPAPADTGIFRDLTAAARAGQRFVEDLHVRIAPTLARIHAAAKSPVEFLRQAVAKIGEHIRPYVRRFLQDVRKVNAEFAANPTRGSVPTRDRAPLANPGTTPDARGFVEKVDEERQTPSEQTRDQWEAEANKLDKGEVLGKLQTGQTFQNAAEVIAGKRITDEAAWNAIYTGENIAESWKIADAWRRTGTEAARILGARFDPILSASERATVAKTNADILAIDQQLDDTATPDAKFDELMQQRLDKVQSINDLKMTGTARRMLAEIFTSPRKSTDRKLKAIDKKLEDASISPADRARLTKSREAISNAEGKALEEMRRRMLKSGIPLGSPTEMRKRDNILEALREAKAHKSTFTDKLEELYKNILFSASTPKNIISNTAFFASEYGIVRPMEAALNSALKIDSRAAKVSNLGPMLAAVAPGIKRGVRNAIDSWRTEADMFELQTHGPNMNISGKLESRGAAIPGRKGRFIRSMGYRPLMATDSFNKSVVAELEVANYANSMATEKGLKGRDRVRFIQRQTLDYDSPSWKHAVEVAERMTLTDESGAAVRKATEIRDAIPPLRFLLPIIKTPAKELSRALQMTPLGTARIAYKLYRDPVYTRKHLARDVAEQAAAWTIAIGLYAAFAPGDDDDTGLPLITGNQPYSRNRAAEGKNKGAITPPKSIRIGDRWYSYVAGGAPATGLAAVVDGLEGITDGQKDPLTALSEFMVKFMGNVKDQTFLSNLADIMDAFEEGGFPKWAGNFAASWSPSMLKRVAKGADPIEREMRAMSPLERLNYQILPTPSAPAKVDLFGRTVKKPESPVGPRGDLLWRVAGNTQVTDLGDRTPFENDMYRMFLNWNNQHKEERWAPSLPDTDYKVGEKKAKWTPAEYERLSTLAGQKALETLVKINASKPFNFDRPTKFDRAKVDKVFELARKYARTTMIREKVRAGRE
jgi:hypothetical protein